MTSVTLSMCYSRDTLCVRQGIYSQVHNLSRDDARSKGHDKLTEAIPAWMVASVMILRKVGGSPHPVVDWPQIWAKSMNMDHICILNVYWSAMRFQTVTDSR